MITATPRDHRLIHNVVLQVVLLYFLALTFFINNRMQCHLKDFIRNKCSSIVLMTLYIFKYPFDQRLSTVAWCSGYHICFTRRRSPVRSWARPGKILFQYAYNVQHSHNHYINDVFQFLFVTNHNIAIDFLVISKFLCFLLNSLDIAEFLGNIQN